MSDDVQAAVVRRYGSRALLFEAGSAAEVAAIVAAVRAAELPEVTELVPAARTVLVEVVSGASLDRVRDAVRHADPAADPRGSGTLHTIPVTYDGEDLALVARTAGISTDDVVALHSGAEYTVDFCGFAPGFGYLSGLPEQLRQPRLESSRTAVPAGSVGIADLHSCVYPRRSPGGWRLIGRADVDAAVLFDPTAERPALFTPGDRVRFEVRATAAAGTDATTPPRRPTSGPLVGTGPTGGPLVGRLSVSEALLVLLTGPQALVTDRGRPGYAHLGVPPSGALDGPAYELGNRLVGNPDGAAGLELLGGGLRVRARGDRVVAVTGAPVPVTVDGRPADSHAALYLPDGVLLEIGAPVGGLRAYLAVAGGLDVDTALGSRSTDLLSGLGPAPVTEGAELPVGAWSGVVPEWGPVAVSVPVPPVRLRVRLGPRDDWFTAARSALAGPEWRVTPDANRIGVRLDGPPPERHPDTKDRELPSEGMLTGAVQAPPDGPPVVFLADHPTTGGYPVIAVVEPADLPLLAQAAPGTPVRFTVLG